MTISPDKDQEHDNHQVHEENMITQLTMMTKIFREHLQRACLETFDLFDM